LAVDTVGFLDEVFFPGYHEDIDFHWRCGIAGLPQLITKVKFRHVGSANRKNTKNATQAEQYRGQLARHAMGYPYALLKWGPFHESHIDDVVPPSGFRTPFNVPHAPLSLWAVDPVHRACIRRGGRWLRPSDALPDTRGTLPLSAAIEGDDAMGRGGAGILMPRSHSCWYNGSAVLPRALADIYLARHGNTSGARARPRAVVEARYRAALPLAMREPTLVEGPGALYRGYHHVRGWLKRLHDCPSCWTQE
jgi:hypothetical protein